MYLYETNKYRPFHLSALFPTVNNNKAVDMETTEVEITPVLFTAQP
jgi:hypothetical protein